MAEIPEYVIRPHVSRVVTGQALLVSGLSLLFYVGIFINITLLGIDIPSGVRWLIVAVLGALIIIQILLSYVQTAKMQYSVFRNRLQKEGVKAEYIMFNAVQDIKVEQNFIDKLFHTGTITLLPNMKLKAIGNIEQTAAYLKQIIQFSRTQYNQM